MGPPAKWSLYRKEAAVARKDKRRRKELREKKWSRRLAKRQALAQRQPDIVDEANALIDEGLWTEARDVLQRSLRAGPRNPNVLHLLLVVYQKLQDHARFCRTAEQLRTLEPDDRETQLLLAGGYLAALHPACALLEFRRFVARWPDDPLADGARETIAEIERQCHQLWADCPFPASEKIELAAMHEQVVAGLSLAEYPRVIEIGERLLARSPDFVPVMNNLSMGYVLIGRSADAIAMSRRVLERQPENYHALANLARNLLLSGKPDEAREVCAALRPIVTGKDDLWCKKAEAFSFVGDDAAVIEAFEQGENRGLKQGAPFEIATLYHLAGVAYARTGDERRARRCWRSALEILPEFEPAADNLDDADLPIGERNGPWPFSLNHWILPATIKQFAAATVRSSRKNDEHLTTKAARKFLAQHPELIVLAPVLLDRGDAAGRKFAFGLAANSETPEMLEALRVFCCSQRGPDVLRMEAAQRLSASGAIPPGRARLWIEGAWRELELFVFKVSWEPLGESHSPRVQEWERAALEALQDDDDTGKEAERLLRKCLEVEGDKPDLLYNLAAAYIAQGRNEKAKQLEIQIHQRWPEYFFGQIAMARMATSAGNYDRAKEILQPLPLRPVLHITEFRAVAIAFVELALAQKEPNACRAWLNLWRQIDPEDPNLEYLEAQFRRPGGIASALAGLLKRT
jgi:tetratricopeptide (TPR) repeat protein